jgi:hypothetical protein
MANERHRVIGARSVSVFTAVISQALGARGPQIRVSGPGFPGCGPESKATKAPDVDSVAQ